MKQLLIFIAEATNLIFLKQKYPAHISNIIALHHAQFGEYSSPSTMVTVVGAESASPWERRHFKGRGDKG